MLDFMPMTLWAVHIQGSYLTASWTIGGLVVAAVLVSFGAWRMRDEEIPFVALLTAAFFVASLIHLPGTGVHLLMTGLVGVVLGRRATVSIPVGLLLQATLFQHGDYPALGVNICVMTLPALLAWQLFRILQQVPWLRRRWFRGGLVALSGATWALCLFYSLALLVNDHSAPLPSIWHVIAGIGAVVLSAFAVWADRRLEHAPEFPLGLLIGELSVLATVFLQSVVLNWGALKTTGGDEAWYVIALVSFLFHLPVAVLEGAVLGFTVGFLARVKPELLGWIAVKESECSADPLP